MANDNSTPAFRSAQEKYSKTRNLTVLETVIETQTRVRSVGVTYVPVETEPCLLLRGKWLQEAGFSADQKVTIHIGDEELLITKQATEDKSTIKGV